MSAAGMLVRSSRLSSLYSGEDRVSITSSTLILVKRWTTSKLTIRSSSSSSIFLIISENSADFLTLELVFLTRGVMILISSFTSLYVEELMVVMMGRSGIPTL